MANPSQRKAPLETLNNGARPGPEAGASGAGSMYDSFDSVFSPRMDSFTPPAFDTNSTHSTAIQQQQIMSPGPASSGSTPVATATAVTSMQQGQLLSPLNTSSSLPTALNTKNNSNCPTTSPESTSFASPSTSTWWYPVDIDNSQYGIQSEEALIQQTFQSPEELPMASNSPSNNAALPQNWQPRRNSAILPYSDGQSPADAQSPAASPSLAAQQQLHGTKLNKNPPQAFSQNPSTSGDDRKTAWQVPSSSTTHVLSSRPPSHITQKSPQAPAPPQLSPGGTSKVPASFFKHQAPLIRKHTPSISEAAAMAAEIVAHETANGSHHLAPLSSSTNTSSSSGSSSASDRASKKPRPCDSCRRRKVRCIMLPSEPARCLHCEFRKQQCTFLEAPLRKSRPKRNDKQSEQLALQQQQQQLLGEIQRPKLQYKDYASLGGHALLKKALSLQYPRSAYFLGPTSVYDPLLLGLSLNQQGPPTNTTRPSNQPEVELRSVSPYIAFALHNDYSEELYARSIQHCDAVEAIVAPYGQHLIDLYFKVVHPAFPILHKQVFIEKYKRTHREFLAPLLAAVYLMALHWWDLDPPKARPVSEEDEEKDGEELSKLDSEEEYLPVRKPDAEALFKLATSTFVDALDRPKLASIQAGLLLLQCRPTRGGNWMLCSQVVAIAEELALGYDCAKWKIPKWERGLRRRLAWAVWLQDQWLSLSESRPAHTDRHRTWLLQELMAEDFPEKTEITGEHVLVAEVENGRLVFGEMIKLAEIVEDIRNELFDISTLRNVTQTEEILERAKPLQLRLRNWYHSLPPGLLMKRPSQGSPELDTKLSSNGYLHLSYFAAELTLHRRIIRSLHAETEAAKANPTAPSPQRRGPPLEVLKSLCREAAKTRLVAAIKFVAQLRREHLHAFWYSTARFQLTLISSFASLLYVTSSSTDEARFYKDRLAEYKQLLCRHVTHEGFEPAASALYMIREVLGRVPELCEGDAEVYGQLDEWRREIESRKEEEREEAEQAALAAAAAAAAASAAAETASTYAMLPLPQDQDDDDVLLVKDEMELAIKRQFAEMDHGIAQEDVSGVKKIRT